jgi:hypothetical protein
MNVLNIKKYEPLIDQWFEQLFGNRFKHRFETIILYLALGGFFLHLAIITALRFEWIPFVTPPSSLFNHPIAAIYTPFTLILIYEVYLLVYYLPRSFTSSVSKQYEIISLIVIRRIFKDISKLELTENWFESKYDWLFSVDIAGFVILFFLIFLFSRFARKRPVRESSRNPAAFILSKKLISILLIPVLLVLSLYSFGDFLLDLRLYELGRTSTITDINHIFYNEFFTILIVVDVTILLLSLRYTDRYSQLIRNSGFVISTVLIRLSFSAEGLLNMAMILLGVLFGVLVLWIYNLIEQLEVEPDQNGV